MILADENIDHSLIATIRTLGIEVYSIYEQQRGTLDDSIIELSRNPPSIILTEDKDFGEWVFAHNIRDISVILLRYHFQDTEQIREILVKILSESFDDLFGKFTTITPNKIRIRVL
jgi:predicted nuclease of predicted toxin-antitoxin system